jgi:hypothetical protein
MTRHDYWNKKNWNWLAVLCVAVAFTTFSLPQFGLQSAVAQDKKEEAAMEEEAPLKNPPKKKNPRPSPMPPPRPRPPAAAKKAT